MLARSVRNPLIIGVGTGLVLVSGTAPAALADTASPTPTPSTVTSPSATPSDSPSTTAAPSTPTSTSSGDTTSSPPASTPPPIALKVAVERKSTSAIHAGAKVELIAHVSTELDAVHSVKLSISATPKEDVSDIDAKCVLSAGLCELGDLAKATVKDVVFTLTVSAKMTSGTIKVLTDALSTPDNADATPTPYSLKVTKAPKPKPSATHSSSSSSSNNSSSSGSSTSSTSSGSSLPVGGTNNAGGTTNNTPNNTTVLPSIAPQQTQAPATAPVQNTGNSQRMRGTNASADELTFDKLASTQAAWLAALLVAFSLLLTQIRLGRVGAGTPKRKGAHRRTRRPGSAH